MTNCLVCQRTRTVECSHIDCPHRRHYTAQLPDGQTRVHTPGFASNGKEGEERPSAGDAIRRSTPYRE